MIPHYNDLTEWEHAQLVCVYGASLYLCAMQQELEEKKDSLPSIQQARLFKLTDALNKMEPPDFILLHAECGAYYESNGVTATEQGLSIAILIANNMLENEELFSDPSELQRTLLCS